MKNVSKEYSYLFNEITEIILELELLRERLIKCQQNSEEIYISDTCEQ